MYDLLQKGITDFGHHKLDGTEQYPPIHQFEKSIDEAYLLLRTKLLLAVPLSILSKLLFFVTAGFLVGGGGADVFTAVFFVSG